MTVINKINKNYKRSQKGRSMVEMLGVLAIIGVLSVGGLYGYGVAMKKHKANQLLHEASMHAATVSAQIMSGKDPTGLTNFGTGNTITLDIDSIAGNTTFKLKMTGIGKDVCEQMKNSKGGMVRDVTCDDATGDATITYYKNLATDPAEGEKSPTGGAFCKAGIVKLYNCETKTTTDCCPDTEECTQPMDCGCSSDEDCPGQQICDIYNEEGTCRCPSNMDGMGGTEYLGRDALTCCDFGHPYSGSNEYEGVDIPACGCPDSFLGAGFGEDGTTCCKNGRAWDDDSRDYTGANVQICGCPDGPYGTSEISDDGSICCSVGFVLNEAEGHYDGSINPAVCGCPPDIIFGQPLDEIWGPEYGNEPPEGWVWTFGTVSTGNICCYDGLAWDPDSYSYEALNIEACGCPVDWDENANKEMPGENKNGVCCLNGMAWEFDTGSYTLEDPRCK